MKTLEFTTSQFCGNKDTGHPHPLKFVRIFDMNNYVANEFIFDNSCIGGKFTANVQTQQTQKYHT